ncbi:MAG: hypothetical protein LBU69_03960, partial [Deltaproteobacteria bacterium]|nr:hypothetical protein [Deltaproteobacteria bacterium]
MPNSFRTPFLKNCKRLKACSFLFFLLLIACLFPPDDLTASGLKIGDCEGSQIFQEPNKAQGSHNNNDDVSVMDTYGLRRMWDVFYVAQTNQKTPGLTMPTQAISGQGTPETAEPYCPGEERPKEFPFTDNIRIDNLSNKFDKKLDELYSI